MAKFEKGDRVYHTASGRHDAGTVDKVDGKMVWVRFDSDHHNKGNSYEQEELTKL